MARELRCREVGFDCDQVVQGETEDEVMQKAQQHGMQAHGMKEADVTPDLVERVRGLIRTV